MHRQLTKKQKAKRARVPTIASASALFLIFILRDVVRENLKDLHASAAQAEAPYEILYGQNDAVERSEGETFARLQDMQNRHKLDMQNKLRNPQNPPLTPETYVETLKETANLEQKANETGVAAEDELWRVSQLIDALPSGTKADLRKLRDEPRVNLEQETKSLTALSHDLPPAKRSTSTKGL